MPARRFLISGRVQGVGFRMFTYEAAVREGLTGWARNRDDGSVEVLAEGEAESLERFARTLRHGPPRARVEAFESNDLPPSGGFHEFTVR